MNAYDTAIAEIEDVAVRVGRSSCDCPMFAFLDGSGLAVIHDDPDHPYPPGANAEILGKAGEPVRVDLMDIPEAGDLHVRVDVMDAPPVSPIRGGTT